MATIEKRVPGMLDTKEELEASNAEKYGSTTNCTLHEELEADVKEKHANEASIQPSAIQVFKRHVSIFQIKLEVDKNVVNYFKENPAAPFIIGFVYLLVAAAARLILGYKDIADELAVYAYYALLIGVLAQMVKLAIRRNRADSHYESTEISE